MIQRDELAARALPPATLFESVGGPEVVALEAKLNQKWAVTLNRRRERGAEDSDGRFERARRAVEDYLAHFPPERRGTILLGALVSVYGKDGGGSDRAVWLAANTDETELSWPSLESASIGHQTIEALRRIAVLNELIITKTGLVVYPSELDIEE